MVVVVVVVAGALNIVADEITYTALKYYSMTNYNLAGALNNVADEITYTALKYYSMTNYNLIN